MGNKFGKVPKQGSKKHRRSFRRPKTVYLERPYRNTDDGQRSCTASNPNLERALPVIDPDNDANVTPLKRRCQSTPSLDTRILLELSDDDNEERRRHGCQSESEDHYENYGGDDDYDDDVYDADDDDYIPTQMKTGETETQVKTTFNRESAGAAPCRPTNGGRKLPEVSLVTVYPQVLQQHADSPGPNVSDKQLGCFIFAIYYPLQRSSLLKLTVVFLEYGSLKQLQELREKSGRMKFGQQIHEDCHYLSDSHKGDVSVVITGFREGWSVVDGANGSRVVQALKYRKLWDGVISISCFSFETVGDCEPEVFNANFTIQQDGLAEEATTFSICEPISKIAVKPVTVKSHRCTKDDDVKSLTATVRSCDSSTDSSVLPHDELRLIDD